MVIIGNGSNFITQGGSALRSSEGLGVSDAVQFLNVNVGTAILTSGNASAFIINGTSFVVNSLNNRVGIGTSNPLTSFYVADPIKDTLAGLGTAEAYYLLLSRENTTNLSVGLGFRVSTTDNIGAAIIHKRDGGASRGELQFYTKNSTTDGVVPVQRMVIDNAGNVGIGTAIVGARQVNYETTDAHFRFEGDSGNASPTEGDFWRESDGLKYYDGTIEHNLIPTALTDIPTPVATVFDATQTVVHNNNVSASWGLVRIPFAITVNKLSFNVSAVTVSGTAAVALYSENGATRLFLIETAGISATGDITTTLSSAVNINPGNYYVGIITYATTDITINNWDIVGTRLDNISGVPVLTGTTTVTANTLPTTITPTSINYVQDRVLQFRLDN